MVADIVSLREKAGLDNDSYQGRDVILFFVEDIGCPHAMRLGHTPIGHMLSIEGVALSHTAQA